MDRLPPSPSGTCPPSMTVGMSARRIGQKTERVDTRSGLMTTTSRSWTDHPSPWPPVRRAHSARDLTFASVFVEASERWRKRADLPTLMARIAADAATILPADLAAVVQYTDSDEVLAVHLDPDLDDPATRDLLRAAAEVPWLTAPGLIPDLALDRRWSRRGTRLAGSPWCTVLTLPLQNPVSQQQTRISWFASDTQAFVDQTGVAELFCRHADLAIQDLNARENLTRGMTARHRIGLAQGILMARHQLTADQVFQVLLRESQNTNTKLNVVADRVIRSGRLPSLR